jgi:hypothetical protein
MTASPSLTAAATANAVLEDGLRPDRKTGWSSATTSRITPVMAPD